mmetsp:Transcript_7769/g.18516  ORF Transcript_7769/g.18516 Transcript_7769/m.18516 type:complete len:462 (-) Transcript_7769:674-2059(-)
MKFHPSATGAVGAKLYWHHSFYSYTPDYTPAPPAVQAEQPPPSPKAEGRRREAAYPAPAPPLEVPREHNAAALHPPSSSRPRGSARRVVATQGPAVTLTEEQLDCALQQLKEDSGVGGWASLAELGDSFKKMRSCKLKHQQRKAARQFFVKVSSLLEDRCTSLQRWMDSLGYKNRLGPGVVTVRELTAGLRQICDRKGAKRFTSAEIEKRCAVTLNGEGHISRKLAVELIERPFPERAQADAVWARLSVHIKRQGIFSKLFGCTDGNVLLEDIKRAIMRSIPVQRLNAACGPTKPAHPTQAEHGPLNDILGGVMAAKVKRVGRHTGSAGQASDGIPSQTSILSSEPRSKPTFSREISQCFTAQISNEGGWCAPNDIKFEQQPRMNYLPANEIVHSEHENSVTFDYVERKRARKHFFERYIHQASVDLNMKPVARQVQPKNVWTLNGIDPSSHGHDRDKTRF